MKLSVGELVDKLSITNLKIARLEADIRDGKEGVLGLEEVGRRALAIRDLNGTRHACIAALNAILDPTAPRDIKVDHASTPFPGKPLS